MTLVKTIGIQVERRLTGIQRVAIIVSALSRAYSRALPGDRNDRSSPNDLSLRACRRAEDRAAAPGAGRGIRPPGARSGRAGGAGPRAAGQPIQRFSAGRGWRASAGRPADQLPPL